MGTWGPGIYQDDVALDIKEEYIDLLRKKETKEEAYNELINNNHDYLKDEDAIPMILALADMQWRYGKLNSEVKQSALELINTGVAEEAWKDNPKELKKRKEILNKLKEKLESPQPPEKHFKLPKPYKCKWQIGDTYAYKLESDLAKEKGLYGRYIIFIKVAEGEWYPNHIIPIVWVKITKDGKLPQTEEEINKLEFIQCGSESYEHLFSVMSIFDETHRKKIESLDFNVNNEYLLPKYRIKLVSTSKRVIPKKLIFLGNFKKINSPKNEYIDPIDVQLYGVLWKNVEDNIIRFYCFNKEENFKNHYFSSRRLKNKEFLMEKGYDFSKIDK